jgi:1,2-phenylacetyl-CoA epoxidase PaaB subunit
MIYEVFARKDRGDALRHIGAINAPGDDLARVYAYNTYDEEKWFDMWIVPRDRFVEVYNRERDVA